MLSSYSYINYSHPVSSSLKPDIVSEAGHSSGSAAFATEKRKLQENLSICEELGCMELHTRPLVVESFAGPGVNLPQTP